MSTMTPDQAKAILLAMPTSVLSADNMTTIELTADSIRNRLEYINTNTDTEEDGRRRIYLDGYFTADELEALAVWMRDPEAVASAP